MCVAGFTSSGLAREEDGKGAGDAGGERVPGAFGFRGRGAGSEAVKGGDDGGEIVEGEEAVGAGAEFAWGLRAAEEEKAEDRSLVAGEVEDGACAMLVLGDAGVSRWRDEAEVLESVEGLSDLFLGEIEDGVSGGALVGGGLEGVERERIVLGGGDLFLD